MNSGPVSVYIYSAIKVGLKVGFTSFDAILLVSYATVEATSVEVLLAEF